MATILSVFFVSVFLTWVCLCVQKFQEIEEAHLQQMKQLIKGYSHSIEDTHVQVGQVGLKYTTTAASVLLKMLLK